MYAGRWENGEYLRNKVFLGKPRHRPLPRYTTKSSWTVCQIKSSLQIDKWKNRLDVSLGIGIIDFIMLGLIQTLICPILLSYGHPIYYSSDLCKKREFCSELMSEDNSYLCWCSALMLYFFLSVVISGWGIDNLR